MMRRLTLLTLLSATSFSYNAKAPGFYSQTELAPTASFISLAGNPLIAFPGTAPAYIVAMQQDINLLGCSARQSFGYGKRLALDTEFSFGMSVGGVGSTPNLNAVPTRGSAFDAVGEFYVSIPLAKDDRALLEPMLGFGYLLLDTQDIFDAQRYGRMNDVVSINAFGPMGGLFARMSLSNNFSLRFGSAYQITKMRIDAYNSYGALNSKPTFRARRRGLLGRLRLDYRASDFVAFMLGFDVQTWSAGGTSLHSGIYAVSPMTVRITRTRISWGVNFNY